jgi:hypothetical protein
VNTPVVFDASGSAATDGSTLQYFWDFGAGQHGGGKTIARMFAAAGTNTVSLTVVDGAGRTATQSKTLTVSAPATPPSLVTAQGSVTLLDGTALEGVTVTRFGAAAGASTDSMGKVSVPLATGSPVTIKLAKSGYADQYLRVEMPSTAGADAYFEAVMRERDGALTLPDAAAGGVLAGRDGATITLPANALINGSAAAVTGPVQISMTPVDVTRPGAGGFPGSFDAVKPDGTTTPIVSFGTTEYVLSAAGQSLQLAPGKTATIEVPLYATVSLDGTPLVPGDTTPLWSLDESTGIWVQEGEGTVVASTASPSGLAMRATVSHFSWWNADIGFDPYGPKPKCVYDTDSGVPGGEDTFATATVCNMLAEIDRGGGASGASGKLKVAALAPTPQVVGYSRRAVLPIAGGIRIPVPANTNIALSATALNGTWSGRSVINGAIGVEAEELIRMRPLQSTGPGPEPVDVPFDATRSLETGQIALFSFTGAALKYARVTVTRPDGSNLIGGIRLLQGATVLRTGTFGPNGVPLTAALPADATYTVEITGTANTPGGYRIQIELLGGVQTDTITLPFDATRTLPAFTTYRGAFSIAAPTAVHVAYQRQGFQSAAIRILGPGGAVFSGASGTGTTQQIVLSLPAAGAYTLDISPVNGEAAGFRVTLEQTLWEPVAPTLDMTATNLLIDLVADHNGKPVVGYARTFANGNHTSVAYMLRRWTGTDWENVGTDLIADYPCNSGMSSASLAFDSANNPVITYGNSQAVGNGGFTVVRRYTGGAWQPIGPNDGVLPGVSAFSGSCLTPPVVQMGADDMPAVAYRADNDVRVQRYDGSTWNDVVGSGGATFSALNYTYDMRLDTNGRLWFVLMPPTFSGLPAIVRRLNPTPTPAWETIGPNGGTLPQTNTLGLSTPHLRFDGAGNPVIGTNASVTVSPGVSSSGTAVYRYNGSVWSSTGGYQAVGTSGSNGDQYTTFALFDGEALMAWVNNTLASTSAPVVQRNTSSGWTAIGPGIGEIPQFTPHGITPAMGWQMRLGTFGTELYMAIIVVPDPSGTPSFKLNLVRKTVTN